MTDERAKELREALGPELPFRTMTPSMAVIRRAAHERLAQREGQALVIEKVNGEWPEDALERLHLALASYYGIANFGRSGPKHILNELSRVSEDLGLYEDEMAEKLDNLKASVERAKAKRSLPDRGD